MPGPLAFWCVVAVTFLWGYGDGLLHGSWPPRIGSVALAFCGMAALGGIGLVVRLSGKRRAQADRDRDTGMAFVGVTLALASAIVVFIAGAAVEYLHRHPSGGGAGPAALAAAWHALTVAAIGLNALGTRAGPGGER